MRFLATILVLATTCAHAQYLTKPRAEQVFVKTNMLQIIKSNDLQGALICVDTNLSNIYSNLITPAQIQNIVTSNINENVQTLVFDSLGNFLTNFPHTYADSSGYQSFYATTTRTDAAINQDLRVDRDARIGRNLAVTGTVTAAGNVTAQRDLTVGTNLTVGGTVTVGDSVTITTNLTVGQSALVVSNLAVAGNLTATGTVFIASTNVTTINGVVHIGDATRSPSAKPSVIVQYSSADSSNATVQADLGNTNTFASGVSARFLESKWGTIRGALDGAPAEVYPSWRMVYIGRSVGETPWAGTNAQAVTPLGHTVYPGVPISSSAQGSWTFPASVQWTNLYCPADRGVAFNKGEISVVYPGLYRISYRIGGTNVSNTASESAYAIDAVAWTNTLTSYLSFGTCVRRYHNNGAVDTSDVFDVGSTRILPLRAGATLTLGMHVRTLAASTVAIDLRTRYAEVYVEWMPLPSTLLNGLSVDPYNTPVPQTQFNEASAFNLFLQGTP